MAEIYSITGEPMPDPTRLAVDFSAASGTYPLPSDLVLLARQKQGCYGVTDFGQRRATLDGCRR